MSTETSRWDGRSPIRYPDSDVIALDPRFHRLVLGNAGIERIARASAAILALDCEVTWADEMPAIVNDPRLVRCAFAVAEELVGREHTRILTMSPMTSDDFALFAEMTPALYLKLGVCGGDECPSLHSGAFDVDERAIGIGVSLMHRIAVSLLTRTLAGWEMAGPP